MRNEPPAILFREKPTLLVVIDGEPTFRQVDGTRYERLLNTRPLVLKDAKKGTHYLRLMDGWMSASTLDGRWRVERKPPGKLKKAQKKALEQQSADLMEGSDDEGTEKPTLATGPVPEILVATQPTEVVIFEGAPNYVSIEGTDLLYADNTSGNVFRSVSDQKLYVLSSGRWFSASSDQGPWSHVSQSDLPDDFAEIPDESPKENVKASVAGTAQAEEALIANSIPQTADVDPKKATFEAKYDGEPKLEKIDGTELSYVVNTPSTIIQVDPSTYYALHDGVWFLGADLAGPWTVATRVPSPIYSIPASSPVHHATYVKIYHSAPDVVVVGYTP